MIRRFQTSSNHRSTRDDNQKSYQLQLNLAPNKKLQNKLAQRCPLVVGSEYRSTKTSCCHHCPVTEVTWEHNDRRCTVVKRQACRSLLSRDRNAAHVIADIFLAVCGTTYSKTGPLWIRDDAVRETNKLNTTPPSW